LCAGYKFAGLLTGNLDFAAFGRAAPWDLAAGFVLIEANWAVTPPHGKTAIWIMYAIWQEKREWYLATRRKEDWERVGDTPV
jgi:fructose-1,6-bisphosphatase/inositol monophosphatase family enzyme